MMMFESKEKKAPLPWWFESHNNSKRSRWLHSTLSELDQKTIAMLKLIEEDADSFAQRAEMYYKKRPELINMVEDFYRAHRSLAERLDMLKSEPRTRMMTPLSSPVSAKSQLSKLMSMEKSYDSYSDTYSESGESEVDDPEQDEETQVDSKKSEDEDSADSEVDDPEQDEETQLDSKKSEDEDSADSEVDNPEQEEAQVHRLEKGAVDMVSEIEVMKLRDEIERLKGENKIQKEQLMQKDEEKREVIRQLTLSMEILKENASLYKSRTAKESNMRSTAKEPSKKWGPFEFNKVKGLFSVKLFNASSKIQT